MKKTLDEMFDEYLKEVRQRPTISRRSPNPYEIEPVWICGECNYRLRENVYCCPYQLEENIRCERCI